MVLPFITHIITEGTASGRIVQYQAAEIHVMHHRGSLHEQF